MLGHRDHVDKAGDDAPVTAPQGMAAEPAHDYEDTRFGVAADLLKRLLEHRVRLSMTVFNRDFDPVIRELSKIVCHCDDDRYLETLSTAPIETLYPLDRFSECNAVKCGGCFTYNRTYLIGSAFSSIPLCKE
jgi:hypothetical protein